MKLTTSQLRRIIREELTRAKNPSNLHELFGFGEKTYYVLHVEYMLKSNDLYANAHRTGVGYDLEGNYKGGWNHIIGKAGYDYNTLQGKAEKQVSGKVLKFKVTTPGAGKIEKGVDVNDEIAAAVDYQANPNGDRTAARFFSRVQSEMNRNKLDFSYDTAFEVSFVNEKGKPVATPKGFNPSAAKATLSK